MRIRRPIRLIAVAVLSALAVGLTQLPANSIPAPWPGLPEVPAAAQWFGSSGNGVSVVARARQGVRIRTQAVAVANVNENELHPEDDPRTMTTAFSINLFLSSPAGAAHGYGVGLDSAVHALAFGAVPVTAHVRLEQQRDEQGRPRALRGFQQSVEYRAPQPVRPGFASNRYKGEFRLTGEVSVKVSSLSVDGVELGLSNRCGAGPVKLDLGNTPYWLDDPQMDPMVQDPPMILASTQMATWLAERHASNIGTGGAVFGEVAIPAFRGCVTASGEDVSRLLTGALSGPGNQVTVGMQPVNGYKCGSRIPPINFRGARKPFAGDPLQRDGDDTDCDPAFAAPVLKLPTRP